MKEKIRFYTCEIYGLDPAIFRHLSEILHIYKRKPINSFNTRNSLADFAKAF